MKRKNIRHYGDGSLNTFGSAIKGVNCTIEIQGELQTEPKIPVRIGLHIGDIVYDDDGIYGDGVNDASRAESLATTGGVLVLDKVFDDLKNHPEFSALSMGKFELKNVKRSVELFALTNKGLAVPTKEEIQSNRKSAEKTIDMEPDFALPYIAMSEAYLFLGILRLYDPKEAYSRAGKYASMAQKIDDNLAETHLALARIHFWHQWDMIGANKLDPLSPLSPHTLGWVYYAMERYGEAVEQCDKALVVVPSYHQVLVLKAKSLLCAGEIDKSLETFKKIPESPNRVTIQHVALALVYHKKGETGKIKHK